MPISESVFNILKQAAMRALKAAASNTGIDSFYSKLYRENIKIEQQNPELFKFEFNSSRHEGDEFGIGLSHDDLYTNLKDEPNVGHLIVTHEMIDDLIEWLKTETLLNEYEVRLQLLEHKRIPIFDSAYPVCVGVIVDETIAPLLIEDNVTTQSIKALAKDTNATPKEFDSILKVRDAIKAHNLSVLTFSAGDMLKLKSDFTAGSNRSQEDSLTESDTINETNESTLQSFIQDALWKDLNTQLSHIS